MSNYLKKLAYVHEAMKKLAQPAPAGAQAGAGPTHPITANPSSLTTTNKSEGLYRGYTLNQMRQNIENYQNRLIDQHIRLNGGTRADAEAFYKGRKNRWYDTSNMTSLREQMDNNRRLQEIATGFRMDPTWSTPATIGGGRIKGQSYNDALNSMRSYQDALAYQERIPKYEVLNSVASQREMRPTVPTNPSAPVSAEIPASTSAPIRMQSQSTKAPGFLNDRRVGKTPSLPEIGYDKPSVIVSPNIPSNPYWPDFKRERSIVTPPQSVESAVDADDLNNLQIEDVSHLDPYNPTLPPLT